MMDMQLQKSYLPSSCTPPPQRGSAHGGVGSQGHPGNIWIWSKRAEVVRAEAQQLLGHHKVGEKAGNKNRAGEGRSSGNLVKVSPKTEGIRV